MTYTKEQRKEIHDQLVAAKPFLWDGKGKELQPKKHRFICHAICEGVSVKSGSLTIATKMIEDRLFPYYSVSSWLVYSAGVSVLKLKTKPVQTYRREWLDHLIKEFSE